MNIFMRNENSVLEVNERYEYVAMLIFDFICIMTVFAAGLGEYAIVMLLPLFIHMGALRNSLIVSVNYVNAKDSALSVFTHIAVIGIGYLTFIIFHYKVLVN